jgi:hypothetical protein
LRLGLFDAALRLRDPRNIGMIAPAPLSSVSGEDI